MDGWIDINFALMLKTIINSKQLSLCYNQEDYEAMCNGASYAKATK